jgi:hypothetical protein
MKTAIDIISEACRTVGSLPPTNFADTKSKITQRMVGSLNRTAEDLTLSYNWLSQVRLKTFTLGTDSAFYDPKFGGYNLQAMTDDCFERFTTSFLWDMTNKQKVGGITPDKFIQSAGTADLPNTLTFMRMGKYLKFYPTDVSKVDIQFYYQTSMIAWKEALPDIKEYDVITEDLQIPYHNPKLLLRGVLLNYARNEGLDVQQFADDYDKFLKKCIVDEAPAATIKFMSDYGEGFLGRFPFIGG